MKQSSKRFVSMLVALAFVVAAFLVFFELLQPTYGTLQQMKGTEIGTQDNINNEQAVIDQAKKLITQYDNSTQEQANLALAMPSGPDVAGALASIYGIAQANGMNVRYITITPPVVRLQQPTTGSSTVSAIKPIGTLGLQLSMIGSYENMKAFLSELEANIRIFDVTAFSITPVAPLSSPGKGVPATSANMFNYGITVTTYYQTP